MALSDRERIEREIEELCAGGVNMSLYSASTRNEQNFDQSDDEDEPYGGQVFPVPLTKEVQPSVGSHNVGMVNIQPTSGNKATVAGVSAPKTPKYAQNIVFSNGYPTAPGNPYISAMAGPAKEPNFKSKPKPPPPVFIQQAQPPPAMPVIKVRGFGRSLPPSEHAIVYQVQFKRGARHYVTGPRCPSLLAVGEFVITQCTRGENLGIVTETMTMQQLQQRRYNAKISGEEMEEGEGNLSQIIRVAHRFEKLALPNKHNDEEKALEVSSCFCLSNH